MQENESAWCFDHADSEGVPHDLKIYGSNENMPHRRLDLSFIPCKPTVGSERNFPDAKCRIDNDNDSSYNKKLDEIIEYIGSPNLYMLMNRQSLQSGNFEIGVVQKQLALYNQ